MKMHYLMNLLKFYKLGFLKLYKIVLGEAELIKGFKLSLIAVTIYYLGAANIYINVVIGIYTPLFLQLTAFGMCLTLLLGLITRSFNDNHAKSVLKFMKRAFFFFGFSLLNGIVAPVAFLMMASVISSVPGDWKWGPVSLLMGIFPFISIVIFLIATKDLFRGLKREIRFNKPPSIL